VFCEWFLGIDIEIIYRNNSPNPDPYHLNQSKDRISRGTKSIEFSRDFVSSHVTYSWHFFTTKKYSSKS
jgi:hypothetical protein